MTYAIVALDTGVFLRTFSGSSYTHPDGSTTPEIFKQPREWRIQRGIFDFITTGPFPPANQKAQGTSFVVDLEAGTVTETHLYVDMSVAEIRDATNNPLNQQISALEEYALRNGLIRTMMEDLIVRSLALAAASNVTLEQLLDPNSQYYSVPFEKVYLNEAEREALRSQRIP